MTRRNHVGRAPVGLIKVILHLLVTGQAIQAHAKAGGPSHLDGVSLTAKSTTGPHAIIHQLAAASPEESTGGYYQIEVVSKEFGTEWISTDKYDIYSHDAPPNDAAPNAASPKATAPNDSAPNASTSKVAATAVDDAAAVGVGAATAAADDDAAAVVGAATAAVDDDAAAGAGAATTAVDDDAAAGAGAATAAVADAASVGASAAGVGGADVAGAGAPDAGAADGPVDPFAFAFKSTKHNSHNSSDEGESDSSGHSSEDDALMNSNRKSKGKRVCAAETGLSTPSAASFIAAQSAVTAQKTPRSTPLLLPRQLQVWLLFLRLPLRRLLRLPLRLTLRLPLLQQRTLLLLLSLLLLTSPLMRPRVR